MILELGEPQRGDVVVFRYPKDPSVDYIKRVVGVPGDQIEYRQKVLYVNGEQVGQVPAGTYIATGSGLSAAGTKIHQEQLGEIEPESFSGTTKPGKLNGEDAPDAEIDTPIYAVDSLVRRATALQLTAAAQRAAGSTD